MGVWRRGRVPDLDGAVMVLVRIMRCGLNCRKMQRAGMGSDLGDFWAIWRGTRRRCRGHDRRLSGFVFLPGCDSGVEIDWVVVCRWTRASREREGSHRVAMMSRRVSERVVGSGHLRSQLALRPALVAVGAVGVVGVEGVVVGVEGGCRGGGCGRKGEEREGRRSVYCLMALEEVRRWTDRWMDGWTSFPATLQRPNDGGCGRALLPCCLASCAAAWTPGRVNEAALTCLEGDPSTPHVEYVESHGIHVIHHASNKYLFIPCGQAARPRRPAQRIPPSQRPPLSASVCLRLPRCRADTEIRASVRPTRRPPPTPPTPPRHSPPRADK